MPRRSESKTPAPRRSAGICRNPQCVKAADAVRTVFTGATEVHRALCCPERLRVGLYDVATRIMPSRHISGDFVLSLDLNGSTVLLLGDLMGKGLSAAMWITHLIDLIHRAAEATSGLSELLGRLNMEVRNSRVRVPLTSLFAVALNHEQDSLTCASAGHPPALVARAGGVELTSVAGPILGVVANASYAAQEIRLQPGESLIAFSDGLIDSAGDDYSVLIEILRLASPPDSSSSIATLIGRVPNANAQPPRKDISLLAIQHL